MKTTHRAYSEQGGDFNLLAHFMIAHCHHLHKYSAWALCRFVDWRYGLFENKLAIAAFWDRNAEIWFDGFGDVAGFVVSESGDGGFAVITAPGFRWLFREIVDWVMREWHVRPRPLSIEITEHQTLECTALEAMGFRRSADFWRRGFDLEQPISPEPLEPGFEVVDMASCPDYRSQRIFRSDAFGGPGEPNEEQLQRHLEFYNYVHAGPIYHAGVDVCVRAPDGRLVAGCEGLIDTHRSVADIERVATHSAFRRRGFARAAIKGCMQRLRDMGIRRAYITGYSDAAVSLYGSLGHDEEMRLYVYEPA